MTIEKLIEAAIAGGWKKEISDHFLLPLTGGAVAVCYPETDIVDTHISLEQILLDPLMWQSAGKELGWPETNHLKRMYEEHSTFRGRMYRFLDALQEGKSLSEAVNEATI